MNSLSEISESTEKKLRVVAWIVTALVLILVGMMRRPEFHITLPDGVSLNFLPLVHAILNSLVTVCLLRALFFIKKGDVKNHRKMTTTAVVLSALFLLCYVAYHFTSTETKFGGEGAIKAVYLLLLITHILLAAISFPLILFTYLAGWADRKVAHRKLAKIVFPMWLYVAVTGPICYLMLRPYY
jgi:putative membrane protein